MKTKNKVLSFIWDYLVILFSCAVYAVTFNAFFATNDFAMGGFTGIAQILNRLSDGLIPPGAAVFVMNTPLLILGVRKQGWKILVGTVFAIAASSLLIDAVAAAHTFQPMEDPLLACIIGGVLLGIAFGLMLRKGATTGGTELLARLLKYKLRHLSIGRLCLIIDVVVVCAYALVFGQRINALYGIIAMYICTHVMDTVIYGSISAKLAMIISDKSEEITQKLLTLEFGVTVLGGKGAWTDTRKDVILCVFKKHRIAAIKAAATEIDPNAFLVVCEAHEVLGEGFGAYSEDSF